MKKNLLIADDNTPLCNILANFFESNENIEVIGICHNGIDAINSIVNLKPDIVLLDLIMPKLDGIGVLQSLKQNKFNVSIPKIIIMSAVGQNNILKEAFLYGIQYYMIKPFSLKTLEERINFILSVKTQNNDLNNFNPNESDILKNVLNIGIPTNILGYRYTIESLKIILNNPIGWIVSEIYHSIAKKNSTSEQCVENAIRNAINRAHQKNNSFYQKLFPKNISERRPSNSLFLTVLAEHIKIENN